MNGLGSGSLPLRRIRLTRNTKSAPPGGFRSLLQSGLSEVAAKGEPDDREALAPGAQAAAEEPARITPPACFSTSIRLARSSVPDYNPARPYSSLGCKTPTAYAEISPQPAITLRYYC